MLFRLRNLWSLGLAASAALPLAGLLAEEQPSGGGAKIKIVVNGQEREIVLGEGVGKHQPQVIVIGESAEAEKRAEAVASEYYLGLELGELSEVVKAQLGLKGGLVVESVVPKSPAAKAGLKAHDILTQVGDKPLTLPADLMQVVGASQDKELALTVVRGGQETTIKATPAKRPESPGVLEGIRLFERKIPQTEAERAETHKRLQEVLEKLQGDLGKDPVRMFFARPGVLAEKDVVKPAEFPKNLKVSITKEGNQPAKIHVQRDDQKWEVTEDKLNELPPDIRQHVQPMLGKGAWPVRMSWNSFVPGAVQPGAWVPNPAPGLPANPAAWAAQTFPADGGRGVEAKLDTILKKLEQLEGNALEQLQAEVRQLHKELEALRAKK